MYGKTVVTNELSDLEEYSRRVTGSVSKKVENVVQIFFSLVV